MAMASAVAPNPANERSRSCSKYRGAASVAAKNSIRTELTHRRPRTSIHEVERLHELLQTYGDAAVRQDERGIGRAVGALFLGGASPSR